ncbi:MAG TPA: fatty-acid oxidation protein subunit alpha [Desulfobulbaceae bacterium]|nr:fatty-acid oxidation protein subunit alpha [Desulfobulbaceae bacterium]
MTTESKGTKKYFELTTDRRGIATLIFNTPESRANIFSRGALLEFADRLDELAEDKSIKALFIESGKEDIFIAGADIHEIKAADDKETIFAFVRQGQDIFTKLASLPLPTIAMIDGACLGGGLEMSLACSFRVATSHPHTRIGLPEVNLGILPGFGGTQRLTPLVGYAKAMELIIGGKRLKGEKALKLGVVDACVPSGYLGFKKEEFIEEILTGNLGKKLCCARKGIAWYEKLAPVRTFIGRVAEKKVRAKTHGHYPAPLAVIKVMEESFGKPLKDGLAIERQAVTGLALTPISKNLIELFLISEQLKKETFSTAQAEEIQHSAIVGTGAMGSGIAWALNNQDIDVRLKDINNDSIGRAIANIRKIYEGIRKRRRLDEREIALKMDKITFSTEYEGFDDTDFLLEAVVEDLKVKQQVYKEFEAILQPSAIIASNTSSLSISNLAAQLDHPNRFVGMHFFNPVHRMPLVEIIAGEKTDDQTVATVVKLAKRMGKTPIKVKESEGFLVNRILMPYLSEAVTMFEEGEDIQKIDAALLSFGMPMGPFALIDTVGVDIGEKVSAILHRAYGERMVVSEIMTRMVEKGWLGKKSGVGFYDHTKKHPEINRGIAGLQKGKAKLDEQTILDRTLLTMINEAARCLEEGVVDNAGYLDMAMVMGTGFPAFRGGLMRYADDLGIDAVVGRLGLLKTTCGSRFAPCDLLLSMDRSHATFYGGAL